MSDVHFNTGVLVHQAGSSEIEVIEVPNGSVLLRLVGDTGNHVTLADTPENLANLLVACLAHLDEHRAVDSLALAEAELEPIKCAYCEKELVWRQPSDEDLNPADSDDLEGVPDRGVFGWADTGTLIPFYCIYGPASTHDPDRDVI